ncbi:hypothetical protein [Arthrobacter crystallopoietes]|uniref:hypothetical protein n=1 Tax=Crystallibacter crystallopoietes TaxID=37928 RepID=UPI001ABEC73C|nr:hypothetical protein [Arthrobacter crystallopoietes]QTG81748.1 hypothetical protein J5251_03870 [Arthrobacter crystallopoietes]
MGIDSQLQTKAAAWLKDAVAAIDGNVVLASPYLAIEVCRQLAFAAKESRYSWQLLTCLDPSAVANGYLSLTGIKDLMESGVRVCHVPRLHAKAYLVGTRGLVGSANLTGAGLGSSAASNFELGIDLSADQVAEAKLVIATWPASDVTPKDLDAVLAKAKDLTGAQQVPSGDLDADSALHFAERLLSDARDGRGLWVKLEYGEPKLGGWCRQSLFASPAKGKPGFKPGDLVFICAAATGDCYAVVEVTREAELKPDDYVASREQAAVERWPWINRTKPRLVPDELMALKLDELGASKQALQNGHVRLKLDQFAAGVRALARLATE